MTYEEAVSYIGDIPKFTSKSDPAETRELMKRLSAPQESFRIVHVAGTNGKGSVSAMLSSALYDAGVKTGLFSSPHLVDIRERIAVNNEICGREEFLAAFCRVKGVVDEMQADGHPHPAYFEFLFAMGMLIFREKGVETAVLETGLGGRLDATNLVEAPELTVITSIGLDHTKYLGNTVEQIAFEKAGILKKGCPVVFDARNEKTAKVIRERAKELGCPMYEVTEDRILEPSLVGNTVDFSVKSLYHNNVRLILPFPALYQTVNGTIALLSAELLPELAGVPAGKVAESFSGTRWPGRMQEAERNVYLDGAHNADGIRELVRTVQLIGGEEPVLLFSQMRDKDSVSSAAELTRIPWKKVVLTSVPGAAAHKPEELRRTFLEAGIAPERILVIPDPEEAFRSAKAERTDEGKLFCAGSLYLIGELLKINGKNRSRREEGES